MSCGLIFSHPVFPVSRAMKKDLATPELIGVSQTKNSKEKKYLFHKTPTLDSYPNPSWRHNASCSYPRFTVPLARRAYRPPLIGDRHATDHHANDITSSETPKDFFSKMPSDGRGAEVCGRRYRKIIVG